MSNNTTPPSLTDAALARLTDPPTSQLYTWAEKPEAHEQLAVGQETVRSMKGTKKFLEDVEEHLG